ncbi:uncharacterized protein G2W53_001895 [Senna tora]|uniref:Uncharacterized protein n=1 Tax=Senna tora TaxID=362788 RepID=A0A834XGB5_9FABA|nr:uncharacterized protein G2W53_001895 [Senna tora]
MLKENGWKAKEEINSYFLKFSVELFRDMQDPILEEEVKQVIFGFKALKALYPNGFDGIFVHSNWGFGEGGCISGNEEFLQCHCLGSMVWFRVLMGYELSRRP